MLLLILPFVACSDDDVIESGGSITFGKTELEVVHGWKEQLDVTVTPADARYFWSVTPGDTIVATIDSTNRVDRNFGEWGGFGYLQDYCRARKGNGDRGGADLGT